MKPRETFADGTPVMIDPAFELVIAIARVMADEQGPDFGRRVEAAFRARCATGEAMGGDAAAAARASANRFADFDWETFTDRTSAG